MRKPMLNLNRQALIVSLACSTLVPTFSTVAGEGGNSSIVRLEIIKREKRIADALAAEAEGDRLLAMQDYEGAIARYQTALSLLPLGAAAASDRARVVQKYSKAGVIHARELGHRGAFDKAKALLNNIISENNDPDNLAAQKLLKDLDDPDRFNIAMSEKHYADTEEVRALFRKGLGYFDLGDFRNAEGQFNQILAIDPHNVGARRQLEHTEREISGYLRASRDHTRLKMMNDVDNLWVTSVPGLSKVPTTTGTPAPDVGINNAPISFRLNNIVIPVLKFDDAPISDVVTYLRKKSVEFDTTESDPIKKGINFILRSTEAAKNVTLDLNNQKLLDAVKSICDVAGMRYDIQANAVVIMAATGGIGSMATRPFKVPPDFYSRGDTGASTTADAATADPFSSGGANDAAAKSPRLKSRPTAQAILEANGVQFSKEGGAFASFSGGRLIVRNTFEQLDAIDALIEGWLLAGTIKQVYITTKFVEVTQRNTDELGFDWLMGAFNVGQSGVFGSGGTTGNSSALNTSDYSFINPGGGSTTGGNPVTRGLRFGADAISRNAIDSIINGASAAGASTVTPGVFALAGVFTDPQFQVMMRALSQKKGVDLMTAPSIIVRSTNRAKIEVIREFPYPVEFDPPQIPQNFGGSTSITSTPGGLFGGGGGGGGSFPVTPTTPSSFSTKNTGVTMEVEANVADDNYTIDLTVNPEVIEFEGFINYGSPIQTTGINALGQSQPVVLTDNKILQPVFATRRMATQVLMWDRQTVGIGGLIREDVQSVEDKVPIFSSVPIIGRLFKTKTEEHFKKNLMIYVTGTLIDPAGAPLHGQETSSMEPEQGSGSDASILIPQSPK